MSLSVSFYPSRCDIPGNWVIRPDHYESRPANSFCPSSFVSHCARHLQRLCSHHGPFVFHLQRVVVAEQQTRAGQRSGSAMHSSPALSLKASIKAVICSDTTFQRHTTRSGQQETDSNPIVHHFPFPLPPLYLLSFLSLERVARALNARIMQMKLTFVFIFLVIVRHSHASAASKRLFWP